MFTNCSLDSGNLKHLAKSQKDALRQLKLSAKQLSALDRYCRLTNLNEISDSEANELIYIWQKAEADDTLTEALALLDDRQVDCLKDEKLFADNNGLRASLSERVPVLAELKLKRLQGDREEIDPKTTHMMVLLCPDGSGYIQKPFPEDGFLDLDEICGNCNSEFSRHRIIMKGGVVPVGK